MMKRAFDFTASFIGFILILPLFLLVALLVKIKLGSPVFFPQQRPGKDGVPFRLYKFRSMTDEKDEQGNLLPNHKRLTRFGCFLRSSSLDELPELINVMKGEMSLVGPRPLLMEYLPHYTNKESRRHDVRPGMTGWAQVNGRNVLRWEEKFELDLWYVKNQSLWLDLKILLLTFLKVFQREGIQHGEGEFMPRFDEYRSGG